MDHSSQVSFFLNVWGIPYWLSFLMSLILTILLSGKKRDDQRVRLYIVAQYFTSLVCLFAALATSSLYPDVWLHCVSLTLITAALAAATLFHSSHIFRADVNIFEHKKILVIYAFPLACISLLLFKRELVYPGVYATDLTSWGLYSGKEPLIPFFFEILYIYLGLMMALTTINYFWMFRQNVDQDLRRRAAYFVLSSIAPAITLAITSCLMLIFSEGYHPKLEPSIVAMSISGAIVAYGILKDHLFNIEKIVTKSISYITTTFLIAWIFLLVEEAINHLISANFFSGLKLARLISAVFVVLLFIPIKNATHNLTDKLFPQIITHVSPTTRDIGFYRSQLEYAWADGKISNKELGLLNDLRSYLGISPEDHERFEREVCARE